MNRIVVTEARLLREQAALLFREVHQHPPVDVVLAPGRVNLIGEHVDYNEGIVLPFTLNLQTAVAIAPCEKPIARLYSASDSRLLEYSLEEANREVWESWARYIQGVWHYWSRHTGCQSNGFELAVSSSLPVGAGLSSSAALCVATLLALQKIARFDLKEQPSLSTIEQAILCQQVEHHFAGVRCGLMDQLASIACQSDHLLAIDFRGPKLQQIPWPDRRLACLLVHTGVQHELASSEYGQRRMECESAARKLGLGSLRDCDLAKLEKAPQTELRSTVGSSNREPISSTTELTRNEFLRARHVITEISRTQAAIEACREGNAEVVGQLMNASHQSLRNDYQVSCEELDFLVESIRLLPGVLGARMTGGGFGGSMIALIAPQSDWESPFQRLISRYRDLFDSAPRWLLCQPSAGAVELMESVSFK